MRIDKPYTNKQYADLAVYCNTNNCKIADRGEYLEAVALDPTNEDKAIDVRKQRRALINTVRWRVERYKTQLKLGINTTDSEEVYMKILQYLQYLRDIPLDDDFPNVNLLTFEEWQGKNNSSQSSTEEV